jgi:hypothetical protein
MMTTRTFPPARAILWEYLARYPLLDFAIVAGLALMIALAHWLPESWRTAAIDDGMPWPIFPVMMFFFGIIALFGVTPNRQRNGPSGYPARMFLYPVSTARLVAWPMLFGAVAMALGWVAVAVLVLPGFGIHMPLGRGALAAAAVLTCLQALSWWPFGTSLAMVLAVSIIPTALITLVLWPMYVWGWGPRAAWALLPLYLIAAYALAVRGVALDRRGDGRGGRRWLTVFDWIEPLVEIVPGARSRFASAARAQLWLEWRSKGTVMFLIAAALTFVTILFVMLVSKLEGSPQPNLALVGTVFAQPLIICAMMGGIFAKDEMTSRTLALSPFVSTRPLTSAALVTAKLHAAALGLLVSCGFTLVTASLWALATGNFGVIVSQLATFARAHGTVVVVLGATMAVAGVLVLVWKRMIGAMLLPLTGRAWIIGSVAMAFVAAMLLMGGGLIVFAPRLGAAFADAKLIVMGKAPPPRWLFAVVPTAIGLALGLKLALSAVAFRAAIVRGLISPRGMVVPLLLWAIPGACLLGLGALLLRPSSLSGWLPLVLISALMPPLGRLPAATLALDWSRHR